VTQFCHTSDSMSARKRRRIMEGPDGFTKVCTPKPSKVHVPRFDPAFDEAETVITDQPPPSVSKPSLKPPKLVPKTVSLSKPVSKVNLKQLEAPTARFVKPEKHPVELRPLKPPISLVESQGNTSTTLQRLPPPPPMRLPETPAKPHQILKSLGHPPLPSKPSAATPAKSMRTISTTHIALTNDLSTETGKAELASIFLHDQHPEILARAEDDEDGNLNLGVSPQKMGRASKGKGKEPKFVRYDSTFFLRYYNLMYG
jgi:hypothetical protein